MRVTNKIMADNIAAQLFRQKERMAETQERIVTGKRINRPSDDPVGISSVLSYRKSISSLEQYNDNIANAKLHIDTTDGVLEMVSELLREAKEIARGRLCLEGNLQIHHMYEHTPEQVAAETAALIEDTFDDHAGLIVSPTASPYIYGLGEHCFPTYKAMVDTVLEWRA